MKFLFIILTTIFVQQVSAQPKIQITENTIVKDTTGYVYPATIWQPLLMKGGHVLKPEDPTNKDTPFFIVRLTEKEKEERLEKLPKPKESGYFKNGEKIKFPNLSDINGNKLQLKELTGKILVVNFWFINCKPCRVEIPDLNDIVDLYKDNDKVMFVAIALDDKYDLKEFLKYSNFKYSIVDNGRFVAEKFGVKGYPTHVIIDTENKVYFNTNGLAVNTTHWIKKSIAELVAKAEKNVAAN